MDIEQLVTSAAAGDRHAFEKLVAHLDPKLRRWFSAQYEMLDDAELTQLTLITVWQKLPKFEMRHEAGFTAWVFQIARRVAMATLRYGKTFLRLPQMLEPILGAPQTGLTTLEEREARAAHLRNEIDNLPPCLRLAVTNMLDGGNAKDLAEELGIKWATVRAYEARAIEQLRRRLRPSSPDSSPGLTPW